MTDPRRDHWLPPTIGEDSDHILDVAIASLAKLRGLAWPGDAGTTLHLLASLIAQAQARLPRTVDGARDQGCSWAEVADLLGVTPGQRVAALHRTSPSTTARLLNPTDRRGSSDVSGGFADC